MHFAGEKLIKLVKNKPKLYYFNSSQFNDDICKLNAGNQIICSENRIISWNIMTMVVDKK